MTKKLALLGDRVYFVKIFPSKKMVLKHIATISEHTEQQFISILSAKFRDRVLFYPVVIENREQETLNRLLNKYLPEQYKCTELVVDGLIGE